MALPDADAARTWGGKTIVDRFGATIGACTQVYTDDATGLPEWATARIGRTVVLLPLLDAVEVDEQVRVAVSRDDVVRAPAVADRHHISAEEEAALYRHYGIAFSQARSSSLLPEGEGPAPARSRKFAYLLAGLVVAGLALLTAVSAQSRRRRTAVAATRAVVT